jgi:hypothetical protein
MSVLNSEYFQKWLVKEIKETNNQERYLFTEFDDRLLDKIYEKYSVNGSVDFLNEKYFLWCFKDPSNHIDYSIKDKVSHIGYSDLVNARNQPSAKKIDFIVLIPKESPALPSNSSDSTSKEINQSENSYSKFIREEIFQLEYAYHKIDRIKQLEKFLFDKHSRDCFHFFLKPIHKDKILEFYGILGEEKHFDNIEISKSSYFTDFIDRVSKVLSDESYSGLSERLKSHDVKNFEIVIQRFWEENYDSAKLLSDNINLVFFRDTEFYKKNINVDEWIIALNDEEINTDYSISYDSQLSSDYFSVINSKNKSKCSGVYIVSNDKYVNKEESLSTYISSALTCDWKVNNVRIGENLKQCEINERNTFLNIQSEIKSPNTKKDKKSLNLIYYTSNSFPDENAMDFAFSISANDENNELTKIELSELKDKPTKNEMTEFYTTLTGRIISSRNIEKKEIENEIGETIEEDDSTLFFQFKKKKTILKRNGQITIDIRTMDPDLSLSMVAFQNEDNDIGFNYKDHEDYYKSIKTETFKNYKLKISEITKGFLFFSLKNSRTEQIKKIVLVVDPEDNLKDEFVSNYFQKLQAQNDSAYKNTVIKIKKKSINDVHAYYFTDKFGDNNTFLPTVFNICDEMVLYIEDNKCPSIGQLNLSPPSFIPNFNEFEEILNSSEMSDYLNTRKQIYDTLLMALRTNVSIDEIDFSSLEINDLIEKQLINYQKLINKNDIAIWLDLFFIVLKNENYNRMDDEALAMFLSPLHPLLLNQILNKSKILSETVFGLGGKPNSIASALKINTLQNWVLNVKNGSSQHFVNIETDSLLFTGFINFNIAFKPNKLSSILKRYDVTYNQSVGYLSYNQIKSALRKSYTYLSNKPEFNICLKSELYDNSTNKAVLDWIKEANDEMKIRYSNQNMFINIFDGRDEKLNAFPENNLISYYKNELGLNFNWYLFKDNLRFDSFDVTIVTSAVPDKIYKYQNDLNLYSHSFGYQNLFNYKLNKVEGTSVFEDIFSQESTVNNNLNNTINILNDKFKNKLEINKNQIENRLSSSKIEKTQVVALSSEVSNTNVLQRTQNKALWEFSIADYSFKDNSRGDYFLLAEEQVEYIDKFKDFLKEIDPDTEDILEDFLDYSKKIGLFQLKNLLSNQNFLKEYIACVTARKLIDCVIINNKNTIIVPYDLFQPRLSKINKEIDPLYQDKGTQYPDFILIEFNNIDNVYVVDFRLIEIKYRSNNLQTNEIDKILKNQTSRIQDIFNELNTYRINCNPTSLWKHSLSIIISEMYNYFHDNTVHNLTDSAVLFNKVINSDYHFRLNDSLLICVDDSPAAESGNLTNGIYFKVPKSSVHQVFNCQSIINNEFSDFFNSMTRNETCKPCEEIENPIIISGENEENFNDDIVTKPSTIFTEKTDTVEVENQLTEEQGIIEEMEQIDSVKEQIELKYDILIGNSSNQSPQYGLLGETTSGKKIAIDLNETSTISLFGVQGAGKSYTIGTITEMVLKQFEHVNLLPSPLASVIFHYSDSMDYQPEFTSMIHDNDNEFELKKLKERYGASPGNINDVILLTPKDKVNERQSEYPSIKVYPIAFNSKELNIQDWTFILGAIGNESTYISQLKAIMKENRDNLTIDGLRESIENSIMLSKVQKALAIQKLNFANEYINDESSLKEFLKPARLIIVDLRDEFIVKDSALGLFVIMLNIFSSVKNYNDIHFNKFIVFDEAHKYMDNKELTGNIVTAIREMRHKGVSIMIASQDPPSLPNEIIELSKIVLLHKFNSPGWVKHIQKSITQFSSLKASDMIALKTGEAFLWAEKASLNSFSANPVKISTRPRVTKHGGSTIQAKNKS